MKNVFQIAIVGGSGSGKTWLAERLGAALAPAAARICLDDFYRDLSHLEADERGAVNFDDPAAIDWAAVGRVADALARGEAAELPRYDFASHTREPQGRECPPRPVVIWDGLWLLHPEWLRERFQWSVFVECPMEERLARRLDRDGRERGRTPESVRRQFQDQVQPMHERFVEPQQGQARRRIVSPLNDADWARLVSEIGAAAPLMEPGAIFVL